MSEHSKQRVSRRAVVTGVGSVATAAVWAAAGAEAQAADSEGDTLGTERWRQQWNRSIVDVTHYGATGDGNTDDSAALQRAIDRAPEAATIVFPPGTYRVSRTIYPRAHQTLLGMFPASVVMSVDGVDAFTVFSTERAHGRRDGSDGDRGGAVVFSGLVIDLNRDGTTAQPLDPDENALGEFVGIGIYYIGYGPGGRGNRVTNCEVRNGWQSGIVLQRPDDVAELDLDIDRTRVHGCNSGIKIYQSSRTSIVDSTVESNLRDGSNNANGVVVVHSGDVLVQGTRSLNNGRHGILVKNSWDFRIVNCTSSGNGVLPNGNTERYGWGIVVGRSRPLNFDEHDNSTDFTIANNTCALNGRGGITLDPTKHDDPAMPQETYAVVSGNSCYGGGAVGIHGIQLNRVRGATVTGNSCRGMPHNGIMVTRSVRCLVAGNSCHDNVEYGVSVNSIDAPEPYGNHVIGPNYYHGNGRDDLFVSSTNQTDVAVMEPQRQIAVQAPEAGFFGASPVARPGVYDVASWAEDRTYDATSTDVQELSNVVGTLIADLRSLGLIG